MNQGFDEFFGIRNGFIDNYNHSFLHRQGYHDLYEGTAEVFRDGDKPEIAASLRARYDAWVRNNEEERR